MLLTDEQKMEIGMRFTMLAKDLKSSLDSLDYAAPEMRPGWRQRMWADVGECCADVIDIVQGEKATDLPEAKLYDGPIRPGSGAGA